MRTLSDAELWAGHRFAAGFEAKIGGIGAATSRYERLSGPLASSWGRSRGLQSRTLTQFELAKSYESACLTMDLEDAADHRDRVTQVVMRAICCEGISLDVVDTVVRLRKGWARQRLNDGLRCCLVLWRPLWERELQVS